MNSRMIAVLGLSPLLMVSHACADEKEPTKDAPPAATVLKDVKQKASYGIGLDIGRNMKRQSVEIDPEVLVQGIRDGLGGGKALLTDEQIAEAMDAFKAEVLTRQKEVARTLGDTNKKEGEAFQAANAKKEGVKVLSSGLQYRVLKSGSGKSPKATDTVTTHYTGTLIDGTVFDSSVKRGQPASFPVNGVIKGWTEALQLMKVGDKWQLVIPAELAYGDHPRPGGPIPPNATLIFEVELLGIQ